MATLVEALQTGIQHHQAGQLDEAAAIYRQVLATFPDQPDALHLLGVVSLQQGRYEEALAPISKAIELKPDAADFHGNLGAVLARTIRIELARIDTR